PCADLFMVVLLSRPAAGSLRRAWGTPATLLLTCTAIPVALALALLVWLRSGGSLPGVIGALALAVFAVGAGSVAAVGIDQRLTRRSAAPAAPVPSEKRR
ncbi:MAG: hypothetical protein JOY80_01095, partial [Candidatus Dormibacteraeota bacterium]|nr:hypothetical protein [Candidatus Dormibacteraeota bacterium]